ncbi:hypothetical protein BCR33DRAFT_50007 [Rhizoclosmatium globosum]|uniref:Uncharacterized protein n=1 Tax=Rhizoclosmatium globosum TaxID=329046 RepID=A0A1Y2AUY5_9FUNG|nr:hypothetical protein BCR33DRAFT_50007 [Rhizoclosmatium globosum]|eukprot:ORY26408.1 hypothetical protein BCR33DRAFT_50007 [Rhizoclosmatium globosum]
MDNCQEQELPADYASFLACIRQQQYQQLIDPLFFADVTTFHTSAPDLNPSLQVEPTTFSFDTTWLHSDELFYTMCLPSTPTFLPPSCDTVTSTPSLQPAMALSSPSSPSSALSPSSSHPLHLQHLQHP